MMMMIMMIMKDFDNDALQHDDDATTDAIEDGAFGYCDNTDVDGST